MARAAPGRWDVTWGGAARRTTRCRKGACRQPRRAVGQHTGRGPCRRGARPWPWWRRRRRGGGETLARPSRRWRRRWWGRPRGGRQPATRRRPPRLQRRRRAPRCGCVRGHSRRRCGGRPAPPRRGGVATAAGTGTARHMAGGGPRGPPHGAASAETGGGKECAWASATDSGACRPRVWCGGGRQHGPQPRRSAANRQAQHGGVIIAHTGIDISPIP